MADAPSQTPAAAPAATTPPATTPPAAPTPPPTPEQLEQNRKDFMSSFVDNPRFTRGNQPPKRPRSQTPPPDAPVIPEPDPAAAAPKADDPPEVTDDAPAPDPDPTTDDPQKTVTIPKTETPTPVPAPAADDATIQERVNARLRELGIDPASAPATPPPPPPRTAQIDDHEARVFAEMAKTNPTRYADIAAKVSEFRELEPAYRKRWMTENPGQAWNSEAEEHAEFYKLNEPQFTRREYDAAVRTVERAEIVAEVRNDVRREMEPEMQQFRAERRMQQAAPIIERSALEASALVMSAAPELAKIMDNGKGGLVLSKATEAKMMETNPVLHMRASELADEAMVVVAELEKMNQLGAAYPMDVRKREKLPSGDFIRPHAKIADTVSLLEDELSNAPSKDQVRGGKTFITIAERAELADNIRRSNLPPESKRAKMAELDRSHWSVDAAEVKKRVIEEAQGKIKIFSQKIKGSVQKPAPPKKGGATVPPTAPNAAPRGGSGGSDTVTSSDVVDGSPASARGAAKSEKTIADYLTR